MRHAFSRRDLEGFKLTADFSDDVENSDIFILILRFSKMKFLISEISLLILQISQPSTGNTLIDSFEIHHSNLRCHPLSNPPSKPLQIVEFPSRHSFELSIDPTKAITRHSFCLEESLHRHREHPIFQSDNRFIHSNHPNSYSVRASWDAADHVQVSSSVLQSNTAIILTISIDPDHPSITSKLRLHLIIEPLLWKFLPSHSIQPLIILISSSLFLVYLLRIPHQLEIFVKSTSYHLSTPTVSSFKTHK
ncbi:hypothetical protein O181_009025 [Austropuccinia psidii MF-1]|uniref:Uncharacterized protein n=1 Tax=Austropuccinia psidii MF-1 TaxID=1389203 RepID=A0A9Q3BQH8_9BASI|nr:hypothetical protein [Austropuccinia psidii MF-1]